jgi:hypothetical protein
MVYEHESRTVVGFLGHPEKEPPPLFAVACGEALGIIHLRDDMLASLREA